jgi:transposase
MSTPKDTPVQGVPASEKRPAYRQDWRVYNLAQTNEKEMVAALLSDLCSAIESPVQRRGRPRIPLADAVFASCMKIYGGASGRRSMTDMREFQERGLIDQAPHYNRIFEHLENPALTSILQAMIEESARPLRGVESEFAVDSSGFSSSVYKRWFDAKYGRERTMGGYVKAHVMVGVTTNVVAGVEVTPASISDYEMFSPLVRSTAARFDVSRISADKAYSGRSNLSLVDSIGAVPFIPFRSNARATEPSLWKRMFDYFREHQEEFYRHYHRRSNVETTFHMIKSKFGAFVRSKSAVAQVNEVLAKVLCHNLCCLVSAFYELGITPEFWKDGSSALKQPRAASWRRNLPPRTPWSGPRKRGRRLSPAGP